MTTEPDKALSVNLRECPFCGGRAHAMKPTGSCEQDDVWCMSCGGNAESVEKWNKRHNSDLSRQLETATALLRDFAEYGLNHTSKYVADRSKAFLSDL